MGRKRARKNGAFDELREGAVHTMLAILFFVLAVFFSLAGMDQAGIAGRAVYGTLSYLLGAGYIIVPALLFVLALSVFSTFRDYLGKPKILGAVLFFFSGLGTVGIFMSEQAGLLGRMIASPLITFLDVYAASTLLIAVLIVSLILIFNTDFRFAMPSFVGLSLPSLPFGRKQEQEDEDADYEDEEEYYEDEEPLEDDHELEEEYEEEPEEDKIPEPNMGDEDEISTKGEVPFVFTGEDYTPPPLSLLEKDKGKPGVGDTKANANIIKRTLHNFGINVEMDEISVGPTVTRYALKPAEGVRISRIVSLQNNLELALAAHPVRIEAPIPGRPLVGIEVPNHAKATVGLGKLVAHKDFVENPKPLLAALGRDITGAAHYTNIAKAPHMLIAGATGSGKSVTIHAVITSLLYRNAPENMRFIMIDPKRVELTLYNGIPHLLTPVITDPKKAIMSLKWAVKEMERRYDVLETERVRDIASYHANVLAPALKNFERKGEDADPELLPEPMPYIVVIVDELADLMQSYPRELEAGIVRLAQMSRAVGIHLILSTQRPSVNVITGLIKANIPSRIALQVSSQIDSRTIIDAGGAEKLLGAGDMLYLSGEMSKPLRVQSPFISEQEVKKVVGYITKHNSGPQGAIDISQEKVKDALFSSDVGGSDDDADDDLFDEAKDIVIEAGKASTSYLQRKLRIGYSRAARLMDILEDKGIIGPADGSKPREVLVKGDDLEEDELEEEYEGDEDIDEHDRDRV